MTTATQFDITAKRTGKKIQHIADGEYVFSVRNLALYTEPDSGDQILFINTSTDEAAGLCPSLRFNVSTEQGQAWLDDFIAEIVGDAAEIELQDIIGLQFSAKKTTTEDKMFHNLGGVKGIS